MATIGWYGPLIDLSKAASHIGDYVQLLVFVHKSTPIQYKLSRGGEVIRTDIQVGDDSRPFFSVSIWQKQMGSIVVAGNLVLLQNVMVTRFGDVVEARTVQRSSLQCLVHPYELIFSKGADNLVDDCRVGITIKEKLRKVIEWVVRAGPTLHNVELHSYQQRRQLSINWKVHEETQSQDCFSLSEVLNLTDSCKATFCASVAEIFLPITWKSLHESEDFMFIRRRLCIIGDKNLADDLICTGCQLCGAPLNCEFGYMCGMPRNIYRFVSQTRLLKSCLGTSGQRVFTLAIEGKSTAKSPIQKLLSQTLLREGWKTFIHRSRIRVWDRREDTKT